MLAVSTSVSQGVVAGGGLTVSCGPIVQGKHEDEAMEAHAHLYKNIIKLDPALAEHLNAERYDAACG